MQLEIIPIPAMAAIPRDHGDFLSVLSVFISGKVLFVSRKRAAGGGGPC